MPDKLLRPGEAPIAANLYDPKEEAVFRAAVHQALRDLTDAYNYHLDRGIFHNGRRYDDVPLTTDNLELFHGFGRAPFGVLALKLNAAEIVYSDTPHQMPMQFVYVRATGACTATLLVV